MRSDTPLGCLVLVRLRLEARAGFPNLDWHCSRVEVCRPAEEVEGQEGTVSASGSGSGSGSGSEVPEWQVFLCNRWLRSSDGDVELHSGKCKKFKCLSSFIILIFDHVICVVV